MKDERTKRIVRRNRYLRNDTSEDAHGPVRCLTEELKGMSPKEYEEHLKRSQEDPEYRDKYLESTKREGVE